MRRSPNVEFAESFEKRLLAYTLAAGAAMFTASQPASAAILYTDLSSLGPLVDSGGLGVDVDGDGFDDFYFYMGGYDFFGSGSRYLSVLGADGDRLVAGGLGLADNFQGGDLIDGNRNFPGGALLMAGARQYYASYPTYTFVSTFNGNWPNEESGFLGFRLTRSTGTHYGWIRLAAAPFSGTGARMTLFGAGFETCPDTGIVAGQQTGGGVCGDGEPIPEPATLGLLALGAAGLAFLRRRTSAQ